MQPKMSGFVRTVFLFIFATSSESAKVLVIPHNAPSHIISFGQFANALVSENHNVTILIPSNAKKNDMFDVRVKTEVYKVGRKEPYLKSKEMGELEVKILNASIVNKMEWFGLAVEFFEKLNMEINRDCEDLFVDSSLFENLKKAQFDLIITDLLGIECYLAYVYKLGVPCAPFSLPLNLWLYRLSTLPSTWPSLGMETSNEMSFVERLQNFIFELLDLAYVKRSNHYIKKYVPEKPVVTVLDVIQNSLLWFYLYDQSISYPRVSMLNTIDVGDLMIRPPKPLPKEYEDILEKSKSGVILVSLGSFFDHIPEEFLQKFCNSFALMKQTIIWRLKFKPNCQLLSNVHIKSWVPQNDLLGHNNLKLFITHAGYNSYVESIANAVPMIAFPLFIDQPHHAHSIQHKGIGTKMNFLNFSKEELVSNVNEIIANETYKFNIKRLSEILHHKPLSAAKRISHWIEHVSKFGGNHLRSNAFQLSLAEFLMLDIYAFLSVVLLVLMLLVILVLYCICKCLSKCFRRKSSVKQKSE